MARISSTAKLNVRRFAGAPRRVCLLSFGAGRLDVRKWLFQLRSGSPDTSLARGRTFRRHRPIASTARHRRLLAASSEEGPTRADRTL